MMRSRVLFFFFLLMLANPGYAQTFRGGINGCAAVDELPPCPDCGAPGDLEWRWWPELLAPRAT